MINIPVMFSEKMVAISGSEVSPSAHKPALMAKYLRDHPSDDFEFALLDPEPVGMDDILRCHEGQYATGVMLLQRPNGFGTFSRDVVASLPWTNGAMYTAAKLARADLPICALASGFHHAGWNGQSHGIFCTFNGLMIAACKLIEGGGAKRVAIVDCDMHWGDGTDDILGRMAKGLVHKYKGMSTWLAEDESLRGGIKGEACPDGEWEFVGGALRKPCDYHKSIFHVSFGRHFDRPSQAKAYLDRFDSLQDELKAFGPEVVIYQSGADVHVDDPCAGKHGGVLTTEQMYERDVRMFAIGRDLQLPIAWCLAGGYQVAPDGSIDKVLELHYNTFKACGRVYGS